MNYLSYLPADSLYEKIIQKYDPNDYPITFLSENKHPEYDFFPVPYFTLSKSNASGNNYLLTKDSAFVKGFLIHNTVPFSEINLDYDDRKNTYVVDYIQGISEELWFHYRHKTEKGYPVFMCNIKVRDMNLDGTIFLPFIFYINGDNEVIAHNWLKDYEVTMDEIANKYLE
jgi:hypothetical protein